MMDKRYKSYIDYRYQLELVQYVDFLLLLILSAHRCCNDIILNPKVVEGDGNAGLMIIDGHKKKGSDSDR
jgi:hypothetical protein